MSIRLGPTSPERKTIGRGRSPRTPSNPTQSRILPKKRMPRIPSDYTETPFKRGESSVDLADIALRMEVEEALARMDARNSQGRVQVSPGVWRIVK